MGMIHLFHNSVNCEGEAAGSRYGILVAGVFTGEAGRSSEAAVKKKQ